MSRRDMGRISQRRNGRDYAPDEGDVPNLRDRRSSSGSKRALVSERSIQPAKRAAHNRDLGYENQEEEGSSSGEDDNDSSAEEDDRTYHASNTAKVSTSRKRLKGSDSKEEEQHIDATTVASIGDITQSSADTHLLPGNLGNPPGLSADLTGMATAAPVVGGGNLILHQQPMDQLLQNQGLLTSGGQQFATYIPGVGFIASPYLLAGNVAGSSNGSMFQLNPQQAMLLQQQQQLGGVHQLQFQQPLMQQQLLFQPPHQLSSHFGSQLNLPLQQALLLQQQQQQLSGSSLQLPQQGRLDQGPMMQRSAAGGAVGNVPVSQLPQHPPASLEKVRGLLGNNLDDNLSAMVHGALSSGSIPSGLAQQDQPPSKPGKSQTGRSMLMYIHTDDEVLSEYQILLRKNIEFFEANRQDLETTTPGRKKPIILGQVGMRCIHCAASPIYRRTSATVYFPAKLRRLYQSAQNIGLTHFEQSCENVSDGLRAKFKSFHNQGKKATAGHGGKDYWSNAARAQGIIETDSGLKFKTEEE